ncbi:MAG: replicative DNA helicase [Candidatus Omnitrophota bacterium]|nr:MAG: replicative DNA helicase [Candidatus Omnitrophota bacterium]
MAARGIKDITKDVPNVKDITLEKVPPQSLEAEIAVLGSMLIEEDAISQGVEIVKPSFFYRDAHQKIFQAIIDLYSLNKPVDLVTLTEELKKRGSLDDIGGAAYLTELTAAVPTAANVIHYARIVKEKAILRNLINTATHIVSQSYGAQQDAGILLDKAEKLIFDISGSHLQGVSVSIKEIVKDSIETIEGFYRRKAHVTGLPTGFDDLDMMTSGLHKGDLIIVAGRPSMGKSAFATCVAEYIGVHEEKPVAIFSIEMSKEQLVQRMLCSHARIELQKARSGFLTQSDWPKLVTAAGRLAEAPIYIDDSAGLSGLELRAKARRMKSRYNIELIIVDYLQLMSGSSSTESRQQEISEISRSLKALAKELNVPLIAVSQLSRAPEKRESYRPRLSDLRESGAIEQDADVVMLLFREEYYNPKDTNKGIAEVIMAKQRNGPVGSQSLMFLSEYTKFENLSRREE